MSQPQSNHPIAYYDGAVYHHVVERVTRGLLEFVASVVPADSRVIDICCGTGALAFLCADKCHEVLGVDISPKMIEYAESQRRARGIDNVGFQVADASELAGLRDRSFDYATVVMGLHEMPTEMRPHVLLEAARVAEKVLVVDFRPRMRWNPAGMRNRFVEAVAGPRHFRGFRDFSRRGGLRPLIVAAGLSVMKHGIIDRGNIEVYTLRHAAEDTRQAVPWLPDRGDAYSFGPTPSPATEAEG